MKYNKIEIQWPNGKKSLVKRGEDWLVAAHKAKIDIPTGCLGGSCGACEIEVNGDVIRACINKIDYSSNIKVEFVTDPYW